MNTVAAPVRAQDVIDAEHLKLLSIFYFVSAGFACLGILFLAGHYALMATVMKAEISSGRQSIPAEALAVMYGMYGFMGAWMLASFVGSLLCGFFLRSRKHRLFTIVFAAFICLYVPLGTILGVFTIVALSRESIRQLYETSESR